MSATGDTKFVPCSLGRVVPARYEHQSWKRRRQGRIVPVWASHLSRLWTLGSRNWSLNSFRFHVAFLKRRTLSNIIPTTYSRILRHENLRMPDAKRPVRERGKFLCDHPANAIAGWEEGGYPGSTFGQEFFLGLRLWMRIPTGLSSQSTPLELKA
jgi:hypothetical protein